jgi:hypothetical protein
MKENLLLSIWREREERREKKGEQRRGGEREREREKERGERETFILFKQR